MSKMSKVSKVIGIDLGTSTSEVACLKNGKPFLIPNLHGQKVTPSVVYISESGEIKVGEDARSYAVIEPENTVIEVKRLMGSQSPLKLGNKYLKPYEVSVYILQYLKQSAESFLGGRVEEAVITVPAYFTNEQRVDTKKAGELAGLRVERIIN
jgi:molecular chaperone DnaK